MGNKNQIRAKTLNVILTEDFDFTVSSPFQGSVDRRIGQGNFTALR